jgi:hypothetical protein
MQNSPQGVFAEIRQHHPTLGHFIFSKNPFPLNLSHGQRHFVSDE